MWHSKDKMSAKSNGSKTAQPASSPASNTNNKNRGESAIQTRCSSQEQEFNRIATTMTSFEKTVLTSKQAEQASLDQCLATLSSEYL
jgi:hypothetical protein